MKRRTLIGALALLLFGVLVSAYAKQARTEERKASAEGSRKAQRLERTGWNPRLAAEYLDARQKEWFAWPKANASGSPCVSCHTGVTYILARPALRRALGESAPTAYEVGLTEPLRARAGKRGPKDLFPNVTAEPILSQLTGVEAIFATLFLTLEKPGGPHLSVEAQQAFERLWSVQSREGKTRGSWAWFDFDTDPYETADSRFYGATLAALAVGAAPQEYRKRADVRPHIAELARYLRDEQRAQPLHNRLMLLWASARLPEALARSEKQALLAEVWEKQQPDGSWTTASLGPWKPRAAAPSSVGGSNYATSLVAFTLEKAGAPRSDPRLVRALDWLRARQDPQFGYWTAESMNKRRDPASMPAKFMQDAATSFAVLALLEAAPPSRR